ncbi:MAG TPA: glycosyltransferase family 2 protein [Dehalococcoidia bacterium]|nr:glycosyltransferase family 2 protein [Dehalococcoidia bacterium]
MPKVSCIMPTRNRRAFVSQAIKYFLRQDYSNKELVVVDDGDDAVADLIPRSPLFQYIRLSAQHSIGVKRNLACEAARGEVLLTWDDDDWYSSDRVTYQVQPLLQGRADVTGLGNTLMLSLPAGKFWACSPSLYDHMFFQGVHGGTLTFWRESWQQGARFASSSLAEEVPVQQALMRQGARQEKLSNQGKFIYIRHGANAWRFIAGEFLDRSAWSQVATPSFIPEEDLEYYGLARAGGIDGGGSAIPVASMVA